MNYKIPIMSEDILALNQKLNFSASIQPGIGMFNPKGVSRLTKDRNKSALLNYSLPGRSRIKLISTFFYDTNEISVELILCGGEYGKDVYHLIGNIDHKFGFVPLHHIPNDKAIGLNWRALATVVMFNDDVEKQEGPSYEEIKHDGFWFRFIQDTIELAAIALVQNS